MEAEKFAFVYYNGSVLPCKSLWAILPVKLILEQGNPAMLTDFNLIDLVPWPPNCQNVGKAPFIRGRVLATGVKTTIYTIF